MATPVEQWLPGMDITAGRLEAMNQRSQFMVTNFGADSSGTLNAAPGIQAALDKARDVGGATVTVPPGIYLIGATLRIYTNTRLSLMAGAEFRRDVAATMLINGDAGQDFGGYSGHSRITIEGGLWNMRGTTAGLTGSAMCISIGHATDIVIRDLEVRDLPGYHAIELNSTRHGTISGCQFRGYVNPGSRDFSEAVQIDLAKSASVFGGFGPYDHTPCEDILVTGCHFGASGTAGTTAWPRGIGSHSATITRWHRRIRISDNSFEGLLQFAVSVYNWEDVTIGGNTFVSCGAGVRIRSVIASDTEDTKDVNGTQTGASQSMKNLAITGNSFRSGGGYDNAIVAMGESSGKVLSLTIVGNTVDGTAGGQSGIRLYRVERVTVSGNIVANTAGTSISTEDVDNAMISGNSVIYAGAHGITMVASDNSNVVANTIRDPQKTGIFVDGPGTDIQIRDNFVDGANRDASNSAAIRFSTSGGVVGFAISGNKTRPGGSPTPARNGIYIDAIHSGGHRFGNDCRGTWLNANPGISDASNSSTVATDIQ